MRKDKIPRIRKVEKMIKRIYRKGFGNLCSFFALGSGDSCRSPPPKTLHLYLKWISLVQVENPVHGSIFSIWESNGVEPLIRLLNIYTFCSFEATYNYNPGKKYLEKRV